MLLSAEARLRKLNSKNYRTILGVEKDAFDNMYEVVALAYSESDKRHRNVSTLDSLLIFLSYWYEYRTLERIGFDYGISKQGIHKIVKWVEATLRKAPDIDLPPKRGCDLEWKSEAIINENGEYAIRAYQG